MASIGTRHPAHVQHVTTSGCSKHHATIGHEVVKHIGETYPEHSWTIKKKKKHSSGVEHGKKDGKSTHSHRIILCLTFPRNAFVNGADNQICELNTEKPSEKRYGFYNFSMDIPSWELICWSVLMLTVDFGSTSQARFIETIQNAPKLGHRSTPEWSRIMDFDPCIRTFNCQSRVQLRVFVAHLFASRLCPLQDRLRQISIPGQQQFEIAVSGGKHRAEHQHQFHVQKLKTVAVYWRVQSWGNLGVLSTKYCHSNHNHV